MRAFMDFAVLPSLALSAVFDKLDKEDQAACAAVCRSWLHVVRGGSRNLRVVVRPPGGADPERVNDPEELRIHLNCFPRIAGLRIGGLAAADDVLPPLPPLLHLRTLDLESCGLSSQPLSSWLLFKSLTSLSYTERNCDSFTGKELLELPLLQDLNVTCLSGDVHGFLSKMPELPALKGFGLSCMDSEHPLGAAASYPWMQNLERLSLRIITFSECTAFYCHLPSTILRSCSEVEQLSFCATVCSIDSILAIAGLRRLRTLQVHAESILRCIPEARAAWRELRGRLTAICVTEDCCPDGFIRVVEWPSLMLEGLPRGLETLRFLHSFSEYGGSIDAASLTCLAGLRQLSLGHAALCPAEPLTALRELTKLQILFMTTTQAGVQANRVQVLQALPQLRELVLDLRVLPETEPDFEALLSGIGKSNARVNLGVHVIPSRITFFPTSFMAELAERLVALRICCSGTMLDALLMVRGGDPLPVYGACKLPRLDHLWRLQLRFACPPDFLEWLRPITREKTCSMAQLRYLCLLFDSDKSEAKEVDLVDAALRSAFPTAVEICIHWGVHKRPLSLCASCSANKMDNYAWLHPTCIG